MANVRLEKVIVLGAPSHWAEKKQVNAKQDLKGNKAELQFHAAKGKMAKWAVVRDPKVSIAKDWKIVMFTQSRFISTKFVV